MLVIDQLRAPIGSGEIGAGSLTMPDSAREGVRHADVENGMIAVRDDVNPKVVVPRHDIR